jgi:hypothetical protein
VSSSSEWTQFDHLGEDCTAQGQAPGRPAEATSDGRGGVGRPYRSVFLHQVHSFINAWAGRTIRVSVLICELDADARAYNGTAYWEVGEFYF